MARAGKGVACGECGRPLRDTESVQRGIGPVCAKKLQLGILDLQRRTQRQRDQVRQCRYRIYLHEEAVVLEDMGFGRSLTNALGQVMAFEAETTRFRDRPVVYRDGLGVYNGVHHYAGVFEGIYPLAERNLDKAVAKARVLERRHQASQGRSAYPAG